MSPHAPIIIAVRACSQLDDSGRRTAKKTVGEMEQVCEGRGVSFTPLMYVALLSLFLCLGNRASKASIRMIITAANC